MRNYRKLNSGLGLAIIAFGALTLAACGASDAEQEASPAAQTEESHGEEEGDHIEMTAEERRAQGLETLTLAPRPLAAVVTAPGEVAVNQYATAEIAPRISAQIIERHAVRGQNVEEGAPLVTLSSVDMAEAQGALIVADREWKRVKNLGRDVVSEKRFIEAEVARQQAKAKLLSYGMAEREVDALLKSGDASLATGRFTLFAPRGGTVLSDDFTVGEFVDPGRALMAVSDETKAWVEARLNASQAAGIAVGAKARVKPADGGWMEGEVIQIQHALDEQTRTLSARIEVDNAGDRLHAGEFAEAAIEAGEGPPVLAIPETAVLLIDDAPTVFRVEGDEIHPVNVETGAAGGGWIEIKRGLAPGDEIVASNAYTLKSLLLKSKLGEGHAH